MTHYSIIPEETVFEGCEAFAPDYMELEVNGIMMQVERLNGFQARIVRIYSGNALDYTNPRYAPGSLLEFQPLFK
ncbi:MAG: hypothetical protein K0R57_6175 [Paenibacillaceae bacterium]|jgi:hypothetical protein|nr:hypothetical protein [Paenibacillaceae bacterium]